MLPLSPDFFCGYSVVSHGSVLAKIGGEGRGAGAVLARCLLPPPPFRPIGHFLPPRERRDGVHAANIDQKAISVNPTLHTWRSPAKEHFSASAISIQAAR